VPICTPLSTKFLIHEKPNVHETRAPHGVLGWYLGQAPNHYHCYHVFVTDTGAKGTAHTLEWFPAHVPMPKTASIDAACAAASDPIAALRQPTMMSTPLCGMDTTILATLHELANIFSHVIMPNKSSEPHTPTSTMPTALPRVAPFPRVVPFPRVPRLPLAPLDDVRRPHHKPRPTPLPPSTAGIDRRHPSTHCTTSRTANCPECTTAPLQYPITATLLPTIGQLCCQSPSPLRQCRPGPPNWCQALLPAVPQRTQRQDMDPGLRQNETG
jgi:hypothetical protein